MKVWRRLMNLEAVQVNKVVLQIHRVYKEVYREAINRSYL